MRNTHLATCFFLIITSTVCLAGDPTFTVNSVNDLPDGQINGLCDTGNTVAGQPECTLRAAIQEANADSDLNNIHFDINTGCVDGFCNINVITAKGGFIPDIINPVFIDGSTQPGNAAVCTTDLPERPTYQVAITGDAIDIGLRLELGSDGSTIRGLNMRNFFNAIAIIRSNNNVIECNLVGTNETGTAAGPGSVDNGVIIGCDSSNNIIGGTTPQSGNLLSANGVNGVQFFAGFNCPPPNGNIPTNNSVLGNFIGTQKDGITALGNTFDGIAFFGGAGPDNNFVGVLQNGSTTNGNVIGGNQASGIFIDTLEDLDETTDNIIIRGNYIGTDRTGTINLGNTFGGVDIFSGTNTQIGGNTPSAGNIIAFNSEGVFIADLSARGNTIQHNSIYQNTGLGIDLVITGEAPDGQNPNDPDDSDIGSNLLQNFPEIMSATQDAGMLNVMYSVPTDTFPLTIEFFETDNDNEEGQNFLTQIMYTATGLASANFADTGINVDSNIIATATDPQGNTSEFSTASSITFLDLSFRDGFE